MAPSYYSCFCHIFPSDTDNSQKNNFIVIWSFYILNYSGKCIPDVADVNGFTLGIILVLLR